MGDDVALMKPIISEDTIAPSIDPIVPNTITAKDGNKSVNAVTGENRTVIANAAISVALDLGIPQ